MNFLAHIYLSGHRDLIKIGNFAADGIRGKQYIDYPIEMQVGILLHRKIDQYTDQHSVFKKSCRRLYSSYGHYSRVIVDIYYDHFLAKNWRDYSYVSLKDFVGDFYQLVNAHFNLLPPKFKKLTPHMITGNWLEGYAHIDGISSVLRGMDRRTQMKSQMSGAGNELKEFYHDFEGDFQTIFNDLTRYSNEQRSQLIKQLL